MTGESTGVPVADIIARMPATEKTEGEKQAAPVAEPQTPESAEPDPLPTADKHDTEGTQSERLADMGAAAGLSPATRGVSGNQSLALPSASPQGRGKAAAFRIDTIRVATVKLDALMTLLGELSVAKNRLAHLLVMIDETIGVWEKLDSLAAAYRSLLSDNGRHSGTDSAKKLLEHHAREKETGGTPGRFTQ